MKPIKNDTIWHFVCGTCLGLFFNFFLFRIGTSFILDAHLSIGLLLMEFVFGFGSDCLLILFIAVLFYLSAGLMLRMSAPERFFKPILYLFTGGIVSLLGLSTGIFLEYSRFTRAYLDPGLFLHYLFQFGQFVPSIDSSDFSYPFFSLFLIVWTLVATAGLRIGRSIRFSQLRLACGLLILLVLSILPFFPRANPDIRNNFITHFFSQLLPEREHFFFSDEETVFDRCLKNKYEYIDSRYPFLKRRKISGNRSTLVDLKKKKPNIVLLFMESFSACFLDRNLKEKIKLTPNMEALIEKSLYFSNFYANGIQTNRGLLASFCSVYPHFGKQIATHFPSTRLKSLPAVLKKNGYKTFFIQGGDIQFDNTYNVLRNKGFDFLVGRDELPDKYRTVRNVGWGIQDEFLFDYTIEIMKQNRGIPTLLSILTTTNHHPFEVPDKRFEKYPPTVIENRFRNTIYYSDFQLGRFIRQLEENGLLENTILVITSDSSQPMKQHKDNVMLISYAYEENFHIPLLIFSPDYIKEPQQYNFVGSQVDILPTLLSLLNIEEQEDAYMGEDMLADDACHYALMTQPFGEKHLVMRYENLKYQFNIEKKKGTAYHLDTDPFETNPIDHPADELISDMHNFLLRMIHTANLSLETDTVYPYLSNR